MDMATAGADKTRIFGRVLFWPLVALLTLAYCALLPALVLPRRWVLAIVKTYLAAVLCLLRVFLGVRWKVTGNSVSASGAVLVAAKHQSALETIILQYVVMDPAIVLKRELLAIPVVGWVLWRLGHIGVNRKEGLDAARQLRIAAIAAHRQGRPIVIFPEGSRRGVHEPADYKAGVDLLYATLKCPCVPVAVNSGRLLNKKSLSPMPGEVTIEFLPLIVPGLSRAEFAERLKRDIERATSSLLDVSA